MLPDYVLWVVSGVSLLWVHILVAAEYFWSFRRKPDPKVASEAVGHTPSWHPERYYKQHPERKTLPRTERPKLFPMSSTPGFTKQLFLAVLFPILGFVLAVVSLENMFPLYINTLISFGGLLGVAAGAWEAAEFVQWKIIKRWISVIFVVIVYVGLLAFPIKKQYVNEYDMNLVFKETPVFTWWIKLVINWNLVKARDYFRFLGVPVSPNIPPIDIAIGNAENASSPPGKPAYRGGINIAESQLREGRGQTHAYYFYQVGWILAPDVGKVPMDARAFEYLLEVNDLTDYFNSALWERPDPNLGRTPGGWPARLWAVRQKFGKRFADRMVAYTLMSLRDNPEEGASQNADIYFCRHLIIGEDRVDHDASKWKEIVSILGQEHSGLDRACNASTLPQAPVTTSQEQKLTPDTLEKSRVAPPRLAAPKVDWSKIARGLSEPEGAPSEGYESESSKEEARLNGMSLTQIRALIADYIHRLQVFQGEWSYPPEEELDTPQNQGADEASHMAEVRAYWDRVMAKRKLIEVVRPTKRATDFHKQFPNLAGDVTYFGNRWPDIHVPNECFPAKTMQQDAAMACADYLKLVIERYPRPQ